MEAGTYPCENVLKMEESEIHALCSHAVPESLVEPFVTSADVGEGESYVAALEIVPPCRAIETEISNWFEAPLPARHAKAVSDIQRVSARAVLPTVPDGEKLNSTSWLPVTVIQDSVVECTDGILPRVPVSTFVKERRSKVKTSTSVWRSVSSVKLTSSRRPTPEGLKQFTVESETHSDAVQVVPTTRAAAVVSMVLKLAP
eukprot:3075707-Rhodomonas_salina.1